MDWGAGNRGGSAARRNQENLGKSDKGKRESGIIGTLRGGQKKMRYAI